MPSAPRSTARILDAALAVFLRHGYERGSMDAIAAEAGVARRTLFNNFDTKRALFAAAIGRFWSAMPIAAISADPESAEDPAAGLRRMAAAIAEFWSHPDAVALARLVIVEGERFPELATEFLGNNKVPALDDLVSYLDRLRGRALLSVADTDLAARQFVGLVNEPLLWFRVLGNGEQYPPARRAYVVEEAVRTFLSRYAPPACRSGNG
ncbi:MAG: TetR/AcrR family transcriptional regulator [Gluconacetobacter diazotrophicus]|nr:TetR/AcrR family transcriptional regulator [Gluconacetobacter diazotrophicus]